MSDPAAASPETEADRPPEPPRHEIVPRFTPVPRGAERSNGWKPEVQRQFIEALAETGSVKAACRAVHRADHGAYMLRRHPEAAEFRAAWDAALDIALRRIEDVAMDRALNGVETPLYYHGEIFGHRRTYNDRLLMFMLRNRAPDRFGGGLRKGDGARGDNAVDRMTLARLKKQWRAEWEAERAAEQCARSLAAREGLLDKLARLRDQVIADSRRASPRVVALLDAYETARDEEDRDGPPDPLPLLPGVFWPEMRSEDAEAEWEEVDG